jgi:hypothetical protein
LLLVVICDPFLSATFCAALANLALPRHDRQKEGKVK